MNRTRAIVTVLSSLALAAAMWTNAVDAQTQSPPKSKPKPFAAGDTKVGKALNDKDCVACHARRFDGKAETMYLRADRKVHTPEQLAAQIAYCNTQLGTNYFPEEEEHIAAYLDLQYYKFKP